MNDPRMRPGSTRPPALCMAGREEAVPSDTCYDEASPFIKGLCQPRPSFPDLQHTSSHMWACHANTSALASWASQIKI